MPGRPGMPCRRAPFDVATPGRYFWAKTAGTAACSLARVKHPFTHWSITAFAGRIQLGSGCRLGTADPGSGSSADIVIRFRATDARGNRTRVVEVPYVAWWMFLLMAAAAIVLLNVLLVAVLVVLGRDGEPDD